MKVLKVDSDSGSLWLLPWARKQLEREALRQAYGHKRFEAAGIDVELTWNPVERKVKLAGAQAYIAADPFHALWSIQSAIMPGTLPGVTPALAWSPTVQHISSLYQEKDGSYLQRHWLVICRYGQRVASYTWDETKAFTDSTNTLSTITGAYVSNVADGSSVTLRDTATDGSTSTRVVAISPDLTTLSTANTYGWIDTGPSDLHPGVQPTSGATQAFTVSTSQVTTFPGFSPPATGSSLITTTTTYTITENGVATGTSVTTTGTILTTQYPISQFVPGATIATFDIAGESRVINGGGHPTSGGWVTDPPGSWFGAGGSAFWDTAANAAAGGSTGRQTAPEAAQAVAYTTQVTATNVSRATQFSQDTTNWQLRCVGCAQTIVTNAASNIDMKRFGGAADVTELKPYVSAISHKYLKTAVVFPAYSATQFTVRDASTQPTGTISQTTLSDITVGTTRTITTRYTVTYSDGSVEVFDAASSSFAGGSSNETIGVTTVPFNTSGSYFPVNGGAATCNNVDVSPVVYKISASAVTNPAGGAQIGTATASVLSTRLLDLRAAYDAAGHAVNFQFSSSINSGLLPSSIYSATIGITVPNNPAPPETPWAVTTTNPDTYTYGSSTKTFTRAPYQPPFRSSRFSRSTTPPLVLGQTGNLTYNGLYGLSGDKNAVTSFKNNFQTALSAAALDSLMNRLCVGSISTAEFSRMGYEAMYGVQGKTYRQTEHVQTSGSFSFTQPAIP